MRRRETPWSFKESADYLHKGGKDTLFRIHDTNEPETIGHAVSLGCIRLLNQHVIDLYSRVPVGANVIVW